MVEYKTVIIMPGRKATKENMDALYSLYRWASQFVRGKDVLEVACGAGQGLGYLAKKAKKIIAGDIDQEIVKCAKDYYKDRIDIFQIDAHNLPFEKDSFDVVILFEAIFYLKNPEEFLKECQRLLRKKGLLLLSTTNKDWPGFNPSPFSFKYFSVAELTGLLKKYNFKTQAFGAFKDKTDSFNARTLFLIRRVAIKLRLIPKTMKGKEWIKRIFFGRLFIIPNEVREGMAEYNQPLAVRSDSSNYQYKTLYFVAKK